MTQETTLGLTSNSLEMTGSEIFTIVESRLAMNAPTQTNPTSQRCLNLSWII
jgi:hypothetical protein